MLLKGFVFKSFHKELSLNMTVHLTVRLFFSKFLVIDYYMHKYR